MATLTGPVSGVISAPTKKRLSALAGDENLLVTKNRQLSRASRRLRYPGQQRTSVYRAKQARRVTLVLRTCTK